MAVKIGTALHGQRSVDDIALDARCGSKLNLTGAHRAFNAATNDDAFSHDLAFDGCFLANAQGTSAHIALDYAVKLDFTLRGD